MGGDGFTIERKKMDKEKKNYQQTVGFWDEIFEKTEDTFEFENELPIKEIEECLDWLVDEKSSIIDFGCGNGKLLLRCAAKGAERGVGIDISSEGIKKGVKFAEINGLAGDFNFIADGPDSLSDFEENEFDGGILSNIIDNLLPEDSRKVLEEFHRIIKPNGKIFLKVNDYVDPVQMEEWDAEKIEENLYKEKEGLYLWNLKDEEVRNILKDHFKIVKRVDIEFEEEGQINRLYYLENL